MLEHRHTFEVCVRSCTHAVCACKSAGTLHDTMASKKCPCLSLFLRPSLRPYVGGLAGATDRYYKHYCEKPDAKGTAKMDH